MNHFYCTILHKKNKSELVYPDLFYSTYYELFDHELSACSCNQTVFPDVNCDDTILVHLIGKNQPCA